MGQYALKRERLRGLGTCDVRGLMAWDLRTGHHKCHSECHHCTDAEHDRHAAAAGVVDFNALDTAFTDHASLAAAGGRIITTLTTSTANFGCAVR